MIACIKRNKFLFLFKLNSSAFNVDVPSTCSGPKAGPAQVEIYGRAVILKEVTGLALNNIAPQLLISRLTFDVNHL